MVATSVGNTSSTFDSRKRGGSGSGIDCSSTRATSVRRETSRCAGSKPTSQSASPTSTGSGRSLALRTGVPARSAGSYATTASPCSGWSATRRPGTVAERPKVSRRSPSETGTVSRSTTTRPRSASTTRPVPEKSARARRRSCRAPRTRRRRATAPGRAPRGARPVEGGRDRRRGGGGGGGRRRPAVPVAGRVVARAALHREPAAVDGEHRDPRRSRAVEVEPAQREPRAVGLGGEARLERGEVRHRLAAHGGHERAGRHVRPREGVAGSGDVDAAHRDRVVARLLERERVEHAAAELEVLGGRDRVQVSDRDGDGVALAAPLDLEPERAPDGVVDRGLERLEVLERRPVDGDQHVARLELPVRRTAGHDLLGHEEPGPARRPPPHGRLGLGAEPEPAELVEGAVAEHRLQRAARDRAALAQEAERAHHAVERQEEARRRVPAPAGVQRERLAREVDDRRARRAARRARGGLVVERVEVVVGVRPVDRRVPVEACQGAGEDRELLPGVVPDHADLGADARALGSERDLARLHEAHRRRVEAEDPEVVDRIAIDRLDRHGLVVQEHRLARHGPGSDHVAVRQDEPALRVHHEARRRHHGRRLRVERARARDPDRHDRGHHPAERRLPRLRPRRRGPGAEREREGEGGRREACAHAAPIGPRAAPGRTRSR